VAAPQQLRVPLRAPASPVTPPTWRHIGIRHIGIGTERMRGVALLRTVRVYDGSDHAGFELKSFLVRNLSSLSCIETGRRAVADPVSIGVVIGGSGNGKQISANKVGRCRAALACTETARLVREHNDAQLVRVGARMHRPAAAAAIVEACLATPFSSGERHARRIRLISKFKATGHAPPSCAG
jgi:ribose 5-phosphate isomerase B